MAWKVIFQTKEKELLGIGNIVLGIKVLLFKWLWGLLRKMIHLKEIWSQF